MSLNCYKTIIQLSFILYWLSARIF